jgi:hypothetical protein
MKRLTKKQAIDLIPAIIDHEATKPEQSAFFKFIENNSDVKRQYKSSLRIKNLLSEKCPRAEAPEHLKNRILSIIQNEELNHSSSLDSASSLSKHPRQKETNDKRNRSSYFVQPALRYIFAAAVILVLTLLTVELLDRTSSHATDETYIVENYAAQHFINASGQLIDPHFSTISTREAENFLRDQYGIELSVPVIEGTEFAGIVMADFLDGFETPLLEYRQAELGETIYVFSFEMNSLDTLQHLIRDENAAKKCKLMEDFHVLEVDDHHVVSWLWNDVWYAAISNHNGYDLASLIDPLRE